MPNPDARMVRGLSIAVLILSILALAGSLLAFAFLGFGGAVISDPSFASSAVQELNSDPTVQNEMDSYALTGDDILGLTALGLIVAGIFLGWLVLCSIVALVAAILGMRNYGNPAKLNGAFGWAVAGAVLALLSGRFITTILLVVSAVYINKVRHATTIPYGARQPQYAQPQYGQPMQQPPVYGQQPMQQPQPQPGQYYQQPGQPAPLPQNPAQPQQPTPPTESDQR